MGDLCSSIPSIMDGLTASQREILLCAFKEPISKPVSVARLGHGEQSFASAMLSMMGSHNINLFYPIGDFGSLCGKDDKNVRYSKVRVSPITQHIFHKADEPLLNGQSIDPAWCFSVIPMVLANGYVDIGTKCSSFVPGFNPRDIIANLKRLLLGEDLVPMRPWYKWFKLTDSEAIIEGYMDHVMVAEELSERLLSKTLKLCTKDLNLLDPNGALKNYDTPEQILEDFFHIGLEFYKKRKLSLCQELENALKLLDNKVRFIREVAGGNILLNIRKKEEMRDQLKNKGFTPSPAMIPGTEYDYLLSMRLGSIFDDSLQRLLSERATKEAELHELTLARPESLWLQDLDGLLIQLDEQEQRNDDDDDDDYDYDYDYDYDEDADEEMTETV